jgi:hypothetical protein
MVRVHGVSFQGFFFAEVRGDAVTVLAFCVVRDCVWFRLLSSACTMLSKTRCVGVKWTFENVDLCRVFHC